MSATAVNLTPEWISQYQCHEWSDPIELQLDSSEYQDLGAKIDLKHPSLPQVHCDGDSEKAEEMWKRGCRDFFFRDEEQIMAAGLDKSYGYDLGRLTSPWMSFLAGTLVMITYKGVDESPRKFTIFCELTQ